jgi:selenocysteine lyase/cysteine desulfurase
MTPAEFARRFAPFDGHAYLNAASQGPLPLAALEAGREALGLKEQPWRMTTRPHVAAIQEVRTLTARLFGAREESVALVTGAGAVVNAVARGLPLERGDEVLLPEHEFPANDFPWRWLERRGVVLRVVKGEGPAGAVSAARLAAEVGPRTRVVAFSQVSYLHGGRIDPAPVLEASRRVGALTCVDGSQAAGAEPFDFDASGVDVWAAAGCKFLCGPVGTGIGLFSARALDRIAVGDVNWMSVVGAENVTALPTTVELRPGALRYDAHELGGLNNLLPFAASLRTIIDATPAAVNAHARALCDRLLDRLPAGWTAASPLLPGSRSHLLCLRARSPAETKAGFEALAEAQVTTSLRGGSIRVAPHLYNTPAEVDRLAAVLAGRKNGSQRENPANVR